MKLEVCFQKSSFAIFTLISLLSYHIFIMSTILHLLNSSRYRYILFYIANLSTPLHNNFGRDVSNV